MRELLELLARAHEVALRNMPSVVARIINATPKEAIEHYSIPEPNSGCWLWLGACDQNGYGRVNIAGKQRFAHRVAYEAFFGHIEQGLVIDHLCRNRYCVNPEHLEAVTHAVNLQRGLYKALRRAKPSVTHCVKGHEFTPENTRVYPPPAPGRREVRVCKTCQREWAKKSAWRLARET